MILAAAGRDAQHRLAVAITDAHFIAAENIADADVLADIATDYGFDRVQARAIAIDPEQHHRVETEAFKSANAGVRPVPHFVFGDSIVINGGRSETRLLRQYKQLPAQSLSDASSQFQRCMDPAKTLTAWNYVTYAVPLLSPKRLHPRVKHLRGHESA